MLICYLFLLSKGNRLETKTIVDYSQIIFAPFNAFLGRSNFKYLFKHDSKSSQWKHFKHFMQKDAFNCYWWMLYMPFLLIKGDYAPGLHLRFVSRHASIENRNRLIYHCSGTISKVRTFFLTWVLYNSSRQPPIP